MKLTTLVLFLWTCFAFGQELVPNNGVAPSKPRWIALKNATIYVSADKKIERGTILIQDDHIVKIGSLVIVPDDAVVYDYEGKTILPAFIDVNSSIGIPKLTGKNSFSPQFLSNKTGAYYWNECIHPEIRAVELFTFDEKAADEYLNKGFGLVSTHQHDGIAQGTSAVFALGFTDYNKQLISGDAAAHFSFRKGVSGQSYPSSQMGSIALFRQALYDAKWYGQAKEKEQNLSLDALNKQLASPLFFSTEDKLEILRAQEIAKEFGLQFTYLGSGNEYEIANELAKQKCRLVLPLNFPAAYDVKDPYVAKDIPLSDLKHWETAPFNAAILKDAGVDFALSSIGLSPSEFWKNLRKAISSGLSVEHALAALTSIPAGMLGIDKNFGSLEVDKKASFIVYSEDPLLKDASVLESWSLGQQRVFSAPQSVDLRGKFNLVIDNEYLTLELSGSKESPSAKLKKKNLNANSEQEGSEGKKTRSGRKKKEQPVANDSTDISCSVSVHENDITIQFNSKEVKWKGSTSLHGKYNAKFGVFEGDALLADGRWVRWSGIKSENKEKSSDKEKKTTSPSRDFAMWYPNMAYGFKEKPKQQNIIIENATIWTNEKDGIIQNGSILIENGKISFVSKGEYAFSVNAQVYDAKGKHLTSGIIDEHSHIAISRGVNEDGQAISAEVSIEDVVNPEDIDIYRQLSGGVTAAQLLHGSANPIGGQSALIKLKWGYNANEMLIPNAPKFIKFALGENVKQSNWGDFNRTRFPQTRMGVEQIYYDAFDRAKKYDADKLANPNSYRVDLELETLSEILNKKRFITCHSYIQSEINMLMKVADSMNFTLNTFTHILEGYKVADKMKAHGAGASTFSDWWAYKYEVNDAIPHNAALMTKMGVVTAINSDDAEMGRRLNQEAAKAVKYGGLSEEEAWKLVTLNPAKLLHLDKRMGSIAEGKDADLVLWSANPLTAEAKVLLTIVDGVVLFDAQEDVRMQVRNAQEKARIITKMMEANEKGDSKPFSKKKQGHFHCNTLGEEALDTQNEH